VTPPNHPNRSSGARDAASRNPPPAEVREAREAAQLTPEEAAKLVHTSGRAWRQWEYVGDDRAQARRMHPAFWELFRIKLTRARGRAVAATIPPPDPI